MLGWANAQTNAPTREVFDAASWTAGMPIRDLGPRVMSGRVVDLAVKPGGAEFYVAYATGGVFHTVNHGTSFEPVFDHAATTAVGCVAADWERGRLFVGTGEVNSSRSSYAGSGLYRWVIREVTNSRSLLGYYQGSRNLMPIQIFTQRM